MTNAQRIKIGVSSCLLGNRVRYDGQHQYREAVDQLKRNFELIPFCPEVDIGLGVPRPKIQLIEIDDQIRCVDWDTHQIDYTQQLIDSCDNQKTWLSTICGYILKTKSPSCGLTKTKTIRNDQLVANGQGIFASRLNETYPNLPLIEEDEFENKEKVADFIASVKRYSQNLTL